jgi:uncharacterized protein (TIGR03067 family)
MQDLARLQGAWHIVALEMDGRKMPAGNGARIIVEGDRFTSLGMGADYKGTLTLNASDKPKSFDLKFTSGPEKGNTNLGIYDLKGDRWRICLDFHGKGRPATFATEPGSGRALEILERAADGAAPAKSQAKGKAKSAAAPADFPQTPAPELEGEWAMVSCVQNGEPMPQAWLRFGKRTAVGNLITVTMNKQVMLKVFFSADRTKEPKEIDYAIAAGPQAGQRQYGIYELKGGKLTTAIAALGDPRPKDFSFTPGDGKLVTTWSRTK